MAETWRLFIALELPAEVLKKLTEAQNDLKRITPARAVRWVDSKGIHLTLKFLGDVPLGQVEVLKEALAEASSGHRRFKLGVEGLGCFPDTRRPRVLWLGVVGDLERLAALQSAVEAKIAPLGYPSEERGFHPHLTLARSHRNASRDDIAALGRVAEERAKTGPIAGWEVETLSLMRSQLKPDGAIYTQVYEISLEP